MQHVGMTQKPSGGLDSFAGRLSVAMTYARLGNNKLERAIGEILKSESWDGSGRVTKLLQGRPKIPDPDTCLAIAEACRVSPAWLTWNRGPMVNEAQPTSSELEEIVNRIVEERLMAAPPRRKRDSGATLRAVGHESDRPPSDRPPPPRRR